MSTLEDRFLKKNIPGKYSQWDEYNDPPPQNDEDDEQAEEGNGVNAFEQVRKWENDSVPKPLQISALANKNGSNMHSTGAKGVLNDYHQHKQIEKYQRQMEQEERNNILSRALNGAYLRPGESSISAASLAESKKQHEGESEDEFLAQYRQKRLNQMKQSHSLPCFGNFSELETPYEYADVIDKSDPQISVIIHIYEPSIPECNLLNQHLDHLARNDLKVGTRFCRIRAFTLKDNFDIIGLPVLVLYRSSKLVKNWTRVIDYFAPESRRKFTLNDVQELLEPEIENGLYMMKNLEAYKEEKQKMDTYSEHINSSRNQNYTDYDDYDSEDAELDELCADFIPSVSD